MRFIEYINERELVSTEMSEEKARKLIEKNCSEILNFYDNNPNVRLYRGIHETSPAMYTVPSNERKPTDLDIRAHKWLDFGFKKVFGDKIRSSAVFCMKNKEKTYLYGEPYMIYPKDGFRFYYSDEIFDIYDTKFWVSNLDKIKDETIQAGFLLYILYSNEMYGSCRTSDAYSRILKSEFGEFNSDNEEYYIKYIEKKYPKSAEEFVKRYYKKSTNLNDIKSIKNDKTEIMLICKGYYSIKDEFDN